MTVGQLKERLARHEDGLTVVVRVTWEGETPPWNVFDPYVCVQEMDADLAADFVVIECNQTDD